MSKRTSLAWLASICSGIFGAVLAVTIVIYSQNLETRATIEELTNSVDNLTIVVATLNRNVALSQGQNQATLDRIETAMGAGER